MAGRLDGRVAVITGGCSGIGLATVRRFLEEGAKVVIGDVDDARGEELVAEFGREDNMTYVHVDVTSKEQVDALFKTAKDTHGSVDIAFNNAGISPPDDDSILDTDLDAWRRVQEVNLTSVYLCCKAALPSMRQRAVPRTGEHSVAAGAVRQGRGARRPPAGPRADGQVR
jgi:NAD(P)-dependent dehydrogenase (short-subunit alcohol dehydrogenase family)